MRIALSNPDKMALLKGRAEGVIDIDSVPALKQAFNEVQKENPFFAIMQKAFQDDDTPLPHEGVSLTAGKKDA